MSFFGKNIKKIRSVKGLSQQAFADLFDLKRGTLGAYEEGRSEPKIDTLIKIANYFSISIDDFLTKELTVNSLVQFQDNFTTDPFSKSAMQLPEIPFISINQIDKYPNSCGETCFVEELSKIHLPLNPDKKFRALEVSNLEMTNHDSGYYPKDIVVGEFVPVSIVPKLNNGTLVFCVFEDQLIFRRLYIAKNMLILRADHKNISDIEFPLEKLKELWRVRYVFCRRIPEFSSDIQDQLVLLHHEISQINKKL